MKPSLWRIKAKAGRFFSQGGQLIRRAWALFVADGPAVLALGLVLMALPGILKTWLMGDVATMNVEALLSGLMNGRYVGMNSTPGWLLEIATAILFVPAMYGCLSLLFSGRWEGSPRSLVSALQTVRIKLGKVVLSGLCVYLACSLLDILPSLANSILGLVQMLVGWIPVVGALTGALIYLILFLIQTAIDLLNQVVMVFAMMALLGEGLWGKPLVMRAASMLWGGRTDGLPALGFMLLIWFVAGLLGQGINVAMLSMGASLISASVVTGILGALGSCFSAAMAAVLYLSERDRVEGIHVSA